MLKNVARICSIHSHRNLKYVWSEEQRSDYFFVTIGSRTRDGGRVTRVSTKAGYKGLALARDGDIVTYDDGSEATIIDGARFAAVWEDKPFALVGSRMSNGDTITQTLQGEFGITVRDGKPVPGPFDSAHTLPPTAATDGGASHA
jgi:uncharacterized Zn-binding protein involved in type VI secretion